MCIASRFKLLGDNTSPSRSNRHCLGISTTATDDDQVAILPRKEETLLADRQREDYFVLKCSRHFRLGFLARTIPSIVADHDLAPVDRDTCRFASVTYRLRRAITRARVLTSHARVQQLGDRNNGNVQLVRSHCRGSAYSAEINPRFPDCVPPNTHPLRNRRIKRLHGLERVTKRSIGLSG